MGKRKDPIYWVVVSGSSREHHAGIPMEVVSERVRTPKYIRQSADRNTVLYGRYLRRQPDGSWHGEDAVNRRKSDVWIRFDTLDALLVYLKAADAIVADHAAEYQRTKAKAQKAQRAADRLHDIHRGVTAQANDMQYMLLAELGADVPYFRYNSPVLQAAAKAKEEAPDE